jgi:nucleotide-binding universal stress UspA family protein
MAPKLVAGYDGSERGEDALALAGALAGSLGLELTIATVVPRVEYVTTDEELLASLAEERERLASRAGELLGDVEASFEFIAGESPARGLHELGERLEPAAIVIGSSHHGAVGRVLLGSVGSSLLAGAPCPIAVAPHGYAGGERRLERLGVAVDGSDESDAALASAGALAKRLGARLLVFAVAEPPDFGYLAPPSVFELETYQRAIEQAIQRVLERAASSLPDGVEAERRLLQGDAGRALAEAAADVDLLIVGSRRYGPVRRVLLGSVSGYLMHHAPCPVLIVPRGAGPGAFGLA